MTRSRKATLRDVAERAGVSRATASYVVNDRSDDMRISPQTRDRVRLAVSELNYRSNLTAVSLRTSRTRTLGLISDFVASGEFSSAMISGASSAARARDHLVVMGETEGDPALEQRLIQELLDRKVDGLIYATVTRRPVTAPSLLSEVPSVLLNCFDPGSTIPSVVPGEIAGGRLAARALGAGRADRVVVVGNQGPPAAAGSLRVLGIVEEMGAHGLEVASYVETDWRVEQARISMNEALAAELEPTALICLNDRIAMGVYEALAEHGLRVPDDVRVVSFDGSSLAGWLRPSVTSVAIPFAAMGAAAVEIALGERDASGGTVDMEMSLLQGGSTGQNTGS